MAKCAGIAYLDGPEAKPKYKELGYTTHKFIDVEGAQCHIVSNKEEIVICFRGTEPDELSDVLADLNAWPDKAYNGHGLVHNGFQEEVNKVWGKIEASLKMMKTEGKKLINNYLKDPTSLYTIQGIYLVLRRGSNNNGTVAFYKPTRGPKSLRRSLTPLPRKRKSVSKEIANSA